MSGFTAGNAPTCDAVFGLRLCSATVACLASFLAKANDLLARLKDEAHSLLIQNG